MAVEDVGLKAKIEGFSEWMSRANAIEKEAKALGMSMSEFAKQSQAAEKTSTQSLRKTQDEMEKTGNAAKKTSREMQQAANNTSGLGRAFSGVTGSLSGVLGVFSQLGFAVFGVQQLGSAIKGLGQAVLGPSMSFERYSVQLEALMGSEEAAAEQMQSLMTFAKQTPFTLPELMDAQKLIVAYGFAYEDVIPMLTKISDAASVLGDQALQTIVRALGQIQAKGKLSAEEMNQLTETGINGWKMLAEASGTTVANIMELSQEGAIPASLAVPTLLEGIGKQYEGLGAKQATTLEGMLSNLEDWKYRAEVALMNGGVFDTVKDQVENLLSFLEQPSTMETIQEWGVQLGSGLQDFAENTLPDIIQGMQEFAATDFKPMLTDIKSIVGFLGDLAGGIKDISSPLMAEDQRLQINFKKSSLKSEQEQQARDLEVLAAAQKSLADVERQEASASSTRTKEKAAAVAAEKRAVIEELQAKIDARDKNIADAQRELNALIDEYTAAVLHVKNNPIYIDIIARTYGTAEAATKPADFIGPWPTEVTGSTDSTTATTIIDAQKKAVEDYNKAVSAANKSAKQLGSSSGIDWGSLAGDTSGANTALKAMQRELSNSQRELTRTQKELNKTTEAMNKLTNARLPGMQAAEDEIFALEQQLKKAQLAALGVPEAVEDANDDTADVFDELAAQQKEIAEGIPVALQKYEWEQEQAARKAEEAIRKAKEASENTSKEQTPEEKEVERLQNALQAAQLAYDIKYEPQIRKIEELYQELTGENTETPIDEILRQMPDLIAKQQTLQQSVEDQQTAIEAQQDAIAEQQESVAAIDTTRSSQLTTETEITKQVTDQATQYDSIKKAATEVYDTTKATIDYILKNGTSFTVEGRTPTDDAQEATNVALGLASGGTVLGAGWAVVGERGPELTHLPVGATVYSNATSQAAMQRTVPSWAISNSQDNRRYYDQAQYNFPNVSQPLDAVAAIRQEQRFQRMVAGRA